MGSGWALWALGASASWGSKWPRPWALANTVVAISTNLKKKQAALEMGADEFVYSKDPESMATAAGSLDLILNTASADHDLSSYLQLLARRVLMLNTAENISKIILARGLRKC